MINKGINTGASIHSSQSNQTNNKMTPRNLRNLQNKPTFKIASSKQNQLTEILEHIIKGESSPSKDSPQSKQEAFKKRQASIDIALPEVRAKNQYLPGSPLKSNRPQKSPSAHQKPKNLTNSPVNYSKKVHMINIIRTNGIRGLSRSQRYGDPECKSIDIMESLNGTISKTEQQSPFKRDGSPVIYSSKQPQKLDSFGRKPSMIRIEILKALPLTANSSAMNNNTTELSVHSQDRSKHQEELSTRTKPSAFIANLSKLKPTNKKGRDHRFRVSKPKEE